MRRLLILASLAFTGCTGVHTFANTNDPETAEKARQLQLELAKRVKCDKDQKVRASGAASTTEGTKGPRYHSVQSTQCQR